MILTRRETLLLLGAAGIQPLLWAAERENSLPVLASAPLLVEFPGLLPQALAPARTRSADGAIVTEYEALGSLKISQRVRQLKEDVWERAVEVLAEREATFCLEWRYHLPDAEAFYSWRGQEKDSVSLLQDGGEPGKAARDTQLFPFAGGVVNGRLIGVVGDSPAFWENRSQQLIDPGSHRISMRTGDGSAMRTVKAIPGDSSDQYRGELDGWQHIRPGQILRFVTWLFVAPVRDLYDVQLAAHRALAQAKGWNDSALTAVLRNPAYLLIRRNLFRNESRYIFISGVTYGWKQWVSDMAMIGLGLQDFEILAEALRGVFWVRIAYEDNAQHYLIISALVQRAGYRPDVALCHRALEFIRDNEKNGAFVPPRSNQGEQTLGWKSYMDLFYYEDGDSPTSNQGFHCGALMAARELGFHVGEAEIQKACNAYADMFNHQGGYFPTSAMRQEVFGGDALYGESVTFAAFGRKSLPDELVLQHCRHAMKIQSPFGLRVVSKANGDLLDAGQYGPNNPHGLPPDRAGAYVQGGSWFFCDAGTWLSGLAHGLDPKTVDALLTSRIPQELRYLPAFNESIHTRTGEPHGNILYGANSLYLWLRKTIRSRLGHSGPDPIDSAIEAYLRNRKRS